MRLNVSQLDEFVLVAKSSVLATPSGGAAESDMKFRRRALSRRSCRIPSILAWDRVGISRRGTIMSSSKRAERNRTRLGHALRPCPICAMSIGPLIAVGCQAPF
jgi:hypothetical protein